MATPTGSTSYGHSYHNVEWRFTGSDADFYGIDPLIILIFPLTFFGLAQEFSWFYFIAIFSIALLILYVSFMTPHKKLVRWSRALRTRYVQGCKWPIAD